MRELPDCLKPFLELREGRKPVPYRDQAGILTGGIGHTGADVREGETWTEGRIDATYVHDAMGAALEIPLPQDVIDKLGVHQYAALISFVFNAGPNPSATLWKVIKAGDYNQVPAELMKWVKAHIDGKPVTLPGLVNRRTAEAALWMQDVAPVNDVNTSAPEIVVAPNPVEKPLALSVSFLASVGGMATAGVPVINQIAAAVQPFAPQSPIVQKEIAFLGIVGAGLATTGIILTLLKRKQLNS
jgi:lysozyme